MACLSAEMKEKTGEREEETISGQAVFRHCKGVMT
jgi:hypothetical protein